MIIIKLLKFMSPRQKPTLQKRRLNLTSCITTVNHTANAISALRLLMCGHELQLLINRLIAAFSGALYAKSLKSELTVNM